MTLRGLPDTVDLTFRWLCRNLLLSSINTTRGLTVLPTALRKRGIPSTIHFLPLSPLLIRKNTFLLCVLRT